MTKTDPVGEALRASLKDRARLAGELSALTDSLREPIAVISTGCRYPGGIDSPAGLWRLALSTGCVMGEPPAHRGWRLRSAADPVRGGYLAEADEFDHTFFGMSAAEAAATDPQHRLLLEVAWELVERAGINAEQLAGSQTGVFIGGADHGYERLDSQRTGGTAVPDAASRLSGRIARALDLTGPVLTFASTGSASLSAIHCAAQSLRRDEADLMIAGGVCVMAEPPLRPGLGEGVGLVLLERLSRARRYGHQVLALLRGSAVNRGRIGEARGDGERSAPAAVVNRALHNSELTAEQIAAVEIARFDDHLVAGEEWPAVSEMFSKVIGAEPGPWLSTLLPNLGDTQAAAGVGSVIKAVEVLRAGTVPPVRLAPGQAGAQGGPGSAVPRLPDQSVVLPRTDQPHRLAVCEFGGTDGNTCLILEQASPTPVEPRPKVSGGSGPWLLWPLTGCSAAAVIRQAKNLLVWLEDNPEAELSDVAWTLATVRVHHRHRAVVVGTSRTELISGLQAIAAGQSHPAVSTGNADDSPRDRAPVPFGHQLPAAAGVCRLMVEAAAFAGAIDDCAAVLAPLVGWDLREMLSRGEAAWREREEVVRPVEWAVSVALARLWQSLGAGPEAFIGPAADKLAANSAAGSVRLADAAREVVAGARTRRPTDTAAAPPVPQPSTRGAASLSAVLAQLADLVADGFEPDWQVLLGGGVVLPQLPTYPFARDRHWLRVLPCGDYRRAVPEPPGSPGEEPTRVPEPLPPAAVAARATAALAEPVAVVGMACRLPGGVESPQALWQALCDGDDLIGPVPQDRGWPSALSASAAKGGFIDRAADFDPAFWGITSTAARELDPRYRLLLEAAWRSVESAGLSQAEFGQARTAICLGMTEPGAAVPTRNGATAPGGPVGTGAGEAADGDLIAHHLGLQQVVDINPDQPDTSALARLALACRAIRDGAVDQALVGGVNLAVDPPDQIGGPTSFCEAVAMVLLMPLARARAERIPVKAVILAEAVGIGPATGGEPTPVVDDAELARTSARSVAGLIAEEIQVVEFCGDDPARALANSEPAAAGGLGQDRQSPLRFGSLRAKTGDTGAAEGVLAMANLLAGLEREYLPPTVPASTVPGPLLSRGPALRYLSEPTIWPAVDRRSAAICALGHDGSPVHLVVADAPPESQAHQPAPAPVALPIPVVCAGHTAGARTARVHQLAEVDQPGDFAMWAQSVAARARGSHRTIVVAESWDEARAGLSAAQAGRPDPRVVHDVLRPGPVGWLCAGSGAQQAGMGAELEVFEVYRTTLEEVLVALRSHGLGAVAAAMQTGAGLTRPEVALGATFAEEVALGRLLEQFGVQPGLWVGYSAGEYAAMHLGGVLSLTDACRLVTARGELLSRTAARSLTIAVRAGEEFMAPLIAAEEELDLAAVNGPEATVVTGSPAAISRVVARLQQAGIRSRELATSCARHHLLLSEESGPYREVAAAVHYGHPQAPLVSTRTGELLTTLDSAEMITQLGATIRLGEVLATMRRTGTGLVVELGPAAALAPLVGALDGGELAAVAVQRTGRGRQVADLVSALAAIDTSGHSVSWEPIFVGGDWSRPDLPEYPFDQQNCWVRPGPDQSRTGTTPGPLNGLLHETPCDTPGMTRFEAEVSAQDADWLFNYRLGGTAVFPATGLVELALEAAAVCGLAGVAELEVGPPLRLGSDRLTVHVQVMAAQARGREFKIAAETDRGQQDLARGWLGPILTGAGVARSGTVVRQWEKAALRGKLIADGHDRGQALHWLRRVEQWSDGLLVAQVSVPDSVDATHPYRLYPAVVDAALQAVACADLPDLTGELAPVIWEGVKATVIGPETIAELRFTGPQQATMQLRDPGGSVVGSVARLRWRDPTRADTVRTALHGPRWQTVGTSPTPRVPLTVIGSGELAARLGARTADSVESLPKPADDETVVTMLPGTTQDPGEAFGAGLSGAEGALQLVQEWLARRERAELVVVTTGVWLTDHPDLGQAAAWGLIGSAMADNPGRLRVIDLAPGAPMAGLATALRYRDEPMLHVDLAQTVHTLRLGQLPAHPSGRVGPDPGTWLVSGAGAEFGRLIARRLVSSGRAARLLLVSRSGPADPALVEFGAELAERGVAHDLVACDIRDSGQVQRQLGPGAGWQIDGILHAAGMLSTTAARQVSLQHMPQLAAVKVRGALNLANLAGRFPGCRTVLLSAAAAWLGLPGQWVYSAANALADAVAVSLAGSGRQIQTQQWGPWLSRTAAAEPEAGWAPPGIEPIPAARVGDYFERCLSTPATVVMPVQLTGERPVIAPPGTGPGFASRVSTVAVAAAQRGGDEGRPAWFDGELGVC